MDLRKLWSINFGMHTEEPEIYQKIYKMSELSEQIIKEIETVTEEKKEDITNIKKRTEKLKKEIDEYYNNGGNVKETVAAPVRKTTNQNNDNRLMTLEEKNNLGNLIRSLNREQLKGIIKILSDPNNDNSQQKSKYFEFDIDKLPPKKLRELERYVKNCINGNNKTNQSNNNSSNKKEIKNDNDKTNNNNHINPQSRNKENKTSGENKEEKKTEKKAEDFG